MQATNRITAETKSLQLNLTSVFIYTNTKTYQMLIFYRYANIFFSLFKFYYKNHNLNVLTIEKRTSIFVKADEKLYL